MESQPQQSKALHLLRRPENPKINSNIGSASEGLLFANAIQASRKPGPGSSSRLRDACVTATRSLSEQHTTAHAASLRQEFIGFLPALLEVLMGFIASGENAHNMDGALDLMSALCPEPEGAGASFSELFGLSQPPPHLSPSPSTSILSAHISYAYMFG